MTLVNTIAAKKEKDAGRAAGCLFSNLTFGVWRFVLDGRLQRAAFQQLRAERGLVGVRAVVSSALWSTLDELDRLPGWSFLVQGTCWREKPRALILTLDWTGIVGVDMPATMRMFRWPVLNRD